MDATREHGALTLFRQRQSHADSLTTCKTVLVKGTAPGKSADTKDDKKAAGKSADAKDAKKAAEKPVAGKH